MLARGKLGLHGIKKKKIINKKKKKKKRLGLSLFEWFFFFCVHSLAGIDYFPFPCSCSWAPDPADQH